MVNFPPLPNDGFTPYLDSAEEFIPDVDEVVDITTESDDSSFWDNMIFPI